MNRRSLEDIEDEARKKDEPAMLGGLYREYVAEYEQQKVDKEPMCEEVSSSMDRATYVEVEVQTKEPCVDIGQIEAEAWGEGDNNKSVEHDRRN